MLQRPDPRSCTTEQFYTPIARYCLRQECNALFGNFNPSARSYAPFLLSRALCLPTGRLEAMANTKDAAKKQVRGVELADRKVARIAGSKRDTPFVKAIGTLSELADQPPLIAISALTIVAGVVLGRSRVARTGVRMLASHWLATQAKSFVKHRIDRTRPFVMLGGDGYHAQKGSSHEKGENSFPSGHTAGAVAVARAVARDFPESATIGYTAAATAAAVQLPRAAHFASDVMVGGLIGLAAEAVVALVLPVEPDALRRAGFFAGILSAVGTFT